MGEQPLEPAQLEAEFLAFYRIAVRRVEAGDQEAVDRGLDVAAVEVVIVARKRAPGLDHPLAAGQNGDPVPTFRFAERSPISIPVGRRCRAKSP